MSIFAREYPRNSEVEVHAHGSDQLLYASHGVMEVTSGQVRWTIPPHFGLWIPARTEHRIRMAECVSLRTLYLRPGLASLNKGCTVLHVGPLLREIIFEIVRAGKLRFRNRIESALQLLLMAELQRASAVPTMLTLPKDPRAIALAEAVLANPALRLTLASMCATVGIGVRTLERVFRKDAGMDFESWRRQARLMKGIELLIAGTTVKEAAHRVGYVQPTAFVALFRKTFGTTPKAWVSALEKLS